MEGCPPHSSTALGIMVGRGRGCEAAAVKCLTGHLVASLERPPWLGRQLCPLPRMTLPQSEAPGFYILQRTFSIVFVLRRQGGNEGLTALPIN